MAVNRLAWWHRENDHAVLVLFVFAALANALMLWAERRLYRRALEFPTRPPAGYCLPPGNEVSAPTLLALSTIRLSP